jgi:hypothetical protein
VEKPFSINNNKGESAVLKPLVIDKMRLPCLRTEVGEDLGCNLKQLSVIVQYTILTTRLIKKRHPHGTYFKYRVLLLVYWSGIVSTSDSIAGFINVNIYIPTSE